MVGLPDFRFHSKSRPFATQTFFDHSKSRLVLISDPHWIQIISIFIKISWNRSKECHLNKNFQFNMNFTYCKPSFKMVILIANDTGGSNTENVVYFSSDFERPSDFEW